MKFQKGHKINLGKKHLNRKSPPPFSEEHKKKIGLNGFHYGMKGKKDNEITKNKKSLAQIGKHTKEKCPFWKGGITPINRAIRASLEYKLWRTAVFKRDNYQCIWGGKEHGSKLEADHIKPFALFPELRFAIDNGRTLCKECHKKTETYGVNIIK